jgi:hypothetical protein
MPSGLRNTTELVLPGAMIGLLAGAIVGGLAVIGGLPAGTRRHQRGGTRDPAGCRRCRV